MDDWLLWLISGGHPLTTLVQFRQNVLNVDLHLVTAADATGDLDLGFGTVAERNQAIKSAMAQLWPEVARLVFEDVTPSTSAYEYVPATIRDLEAIDLMDSDGYPIDWIRDWRFTYNQTVAATPARKLKLMQTMSTDTTTIRLMGWRPYAIPASDSSTLEIPEELEWLLCAGARREIFRKQMHGRANYAQHAVQSRDNDVTMGELVQLYSMATAEWNDGKAQNTRQIVAARR